MLKSILLLGLLIPQIAIAANCSQLTPGACRRSKECSLDCPINVTNPLFCRGKYFCRPKADECEKRFAQIELMDNKNAEDLCQKDSRCLFRPGSCYCPCEDTIPQTCVCACGGGRLPNCEARNKK